MQYPESRPYTQDARTGNERIYPRADCLTPRGPEASSRSKSPERSDIWDMTLLSMSWPPISYRYWAWTDIPLELKRHQNEDPPILITAHGRLNSGVSSSQLTIHNPPHEEVGGTATCAILCH
ncbi:hypothetical protein ACJ73_08263 [Blastomyces percursus]|uniref:Uncharacterized protein n=1 Tax=Blastomyces percursus TaxID=1658174 RepID=A0A1J9QJN8_9EURO|nr:hypothetical protein ACJ73_08263 [Blastomyces percursus]